MPYDLRSKRLPVETGVEEGGPVVRKRARGKPIGSSPTPKPAAKRARWNLEPKANVSVPPRKPVLEIKSSEDDGDDDNSEEEEPPYWRATLEVKDSEDDGDDDSEDEQMSPSRTLLEVEDPEEDEDEYSEDEDMPEEDESVYDSEGHSDSEEESFPTEDVPEDPNLVETSIPLRRSARLQKGSTI